MNIAEYSNITLREAIIELTKIRDIYFITSYFISEIGTEKEITDTFFNKAQANVSGLIDSLLSLPHKETNYTICMDVFANIFDSFKLTSDAYFTIPDDTQTYSLDFVDWADVIDARISEESLVRYGLVNVVIFTLIELSFHGYEYQAAMESMENMMAGSDEHL